MENMEDSKENQKQYQNIVRQMISVNHKHKKIVDRLLSKTGVYQAQHHILMYISCKRFPSQKDIAEHMEVSTATIATSLKKLEKGGYIKKAVDETDNRFNNIIITEKGNKVVEESRQIFASTDQKLFEGFTKEELNNLYGLLQKLDANINKMENNWKTGK